MATPPDFSFLKSQKHWTHYPEKVAELRQAMSETLDKLNDLKREAQQYGIEFVLDSHGGTQFVKETKLSNP